MVYFAYGALGLIDVTRDMWIKESLTLSPADLAGIGVWLSLPWTVKMVFGQLVDSVPIFGSQRRCLHRDRRGLHRRRHGDPGGCRWRLAHVPAPRPLYVLGAMVIVIGAVIQDVVADAMSTEVVARTDADGNPRPDAEVRAELGMVQVLGTAGARHRHPVGRRTVGLARRGFCRVRRCFSSGLRSRLFR